MAAFRVTPDVQVRRDRSGIVRQLRHLNQPYTSEDAGFAPVTPRELAEQYVHEVLPLFAPEQDGFADAVAPQLDFEEEKTVPDSHVVTFRQTRYGIPVMEAGLTVRMTEEPLQVVGSQSSLKPEVAVEEPDPDAPYAPHRIDAQVLAQLLNLPSKAELPRINDIRPLIFRFDPEQRIEREPAPPGEEHALAAQPPTLPLPPVASSIEPGRFYVVSEVLFTWNGPQSGKLNWTAFIEPRTGSVLYLRALVASVEARVYVTDPLTKTGDASIAPSSAAAVLDAQRDTVNLPGLTPPAAGGAQALDGRFVRVQNVSPPNHVPPTTIPPAGFVFSVPTDNFAAVNAYFNGDRLFRLLEDMGFDVVTYFDGTAFPVPVDHRAAIDGNSNTVNAQAPGNATRTGSDGFLFALAQLGTPVSMAVDWRVTLHEFGHALLWDHVHSANFRFAHSAGDSLAAILNDPGTQAPDRFETFPWITLGTPGIDRRHDRSLAGGWAWGGVNDVGGYPSEQILSTTLFRVYQSAGGDARTLLDEQLFAAHYVAFLIIKAIGLLSPATNPREPEDFAEALIQADIGTFGLNGGRHTCGLLQKVIRWSFEKQGAYQSPGAPFPVVAPGEPPEVDVFIEDGRHGEYPFPQAAAAPEVWNRTAPDAGTVHQAPVPGVPNFAYVRIRERGTTPATDVRVRGFHTASADPVWPNDWQPANPAGRVVPVPLPAGGAIAGPFEWTPGGPGESLLMIASAAGDPSNDSQITGSVSTRLLALLDNNIALRRT